ncbi:MAG: hypothetical protein HDQ96_03745 [Lachnospiraceae bacterium]|nr:hypothetical protein [Lachnospiraceae bacterium]
MENRKRQNIIITCVSAVVCLTAAGLIARAVLLQKNPLTEGLINLSKEVTALESEMGKHFWSDAIDQIGSENIQAEYSVNIGGIPELQNITVGIDGRTDRDMERKLFNTEVDISVANTEIAAASLGGTADTLYLQMPSVWSGSIVLDTENVNGQWNRSAAKKQLQLLAGQELAVDYRIDADLFQSFSVASFSAVDFLEENSEVLKSLYENMEVIKVQKAQKEGKLSGKQAESLINYVLEDAQGEQIETTCYLVILQEKELKEIIADWTGNLRLGVYLDSEKRIVRICTLPEELLVAKTGEGEIAINLTGRESTIDSLEVSFCISNGDTETAEIFHDKVSIEGNIVIERKQGATAFYQVECSGSLTDQKNVWELSLAGSVQGDRINIGEKTRAETKVSLEVESLVLKLQSEVICRGSGRVEFAPLEEKIQISSGKEYRIAEMNEVETALFLAECTKNVYENYSGYMRLMP